MKKEVEGVAIRTKAFQLYMLLAGLFITALVTCNLIANKFITVHLGFKTFVISAGVLPYPITFLITDILSEIYGRKKTNLVVVIGLVASTFVLFILYLGGIFPAIDNSPVSNEEYQAVFSNTWRIILASMVAYLIAQLIDIRVYHFWKRYTKGKKLWLRNNGSTIISQLVDTTLVVLALFYGELSINTMGGYIRDGWMFKAICALLDTLLIYPIIALIHSKLKLKQGEEIEFL